MSFVNGPNRPHGRLGRLGRLGRVSLSGGQCGISGGIRASFVNEPNRPHGRLGRLGRVSPWGGACGISGSGGERERLPKLVCAGGLQLGGTRYPLRGPAYLQHGGGKLGVHALGAAEEGGRAAGADEGDDAQAKGPLVDPLAAAAALRPARRGLFDLIVVGTAFERHCMYWVWGIALLIKC